MTSTPLRVTAILAEPRTSGIVGQDFTLDGPLAWAEAVTGDYPPMTKEHVPEIPLPLLKWHLGGVWGWCVSRAQYEVAAHSTMEIRKKPADQQLSRYTTEKKNHHGLGAHKARDAIVAVSLISEISWEVECTDQPKLESLLDQITHLGAHKARGLGQIKTWAISPGTPGAWEDRTLPTAPGQTRSWRPPYWHHQRQETTT